MPRQSLKDTIYDWLESFSLSQLKNIPRTKNVKWQLFWFLTFLITLGAGIWKSYEEVQKYLDYPFDTYKRFVNAQNTVFPAVTICNLNPISQENGNYIRQVKELMTVYRYHLSLIAEKETKNTTTNDGNANQNNGKRVKRSLGFTSVTVILPDVDQGMCYRTTTTFETTSSTTTTTATTTELPSTTAKTTTEQYTIVPSTKTSKYDITSSEVSVPKTTVRPTTTYDPSSTETTVPTSKTIQVTASETTVHPTNTYAPTTEVPSSKPLASIMPQKTKPGATVTQASETQMISSKTAKTQTDATAESTVKYTEFASKNPATVATATSKSGGTNDQSTKSAASTEYPTKETYTNEAPAKGSSSSAPPPTIKSLVTEEPETAASTESNTGNSNVRTTKPADVEYPTSKPGTIKVQTTKPSTIEVKKTTYQSNELFTTKQENVEILTTEQMIVESTTKSSITDVKTPESKPTGNASTKSITVQPTTKSVDDKIVSENRQSSVSATIKDSDDQTTKPPAVKYTTTKSTTSETTASESTTSNQNEILIQITTLTTQRLSQEQNTNYSPSSSEPSDSSATPITKQIHRPTAEYSSLSMEPSDNSATRKAKTMTSTKHSTALPATPSTTESSEFSNKSTTFSATKTTLEDSKERTTESADVDNETTKLEATVPSSTTISSKVIFTEIPETSSITTQIPTRVHDVEYSSKTIGTSDSSVTTITNQISGTEHSSSSTESSGNSDTSQTAIFAATMQSTEGASKSSVFSSSTTSTSSTQQPHPSTNKFGKASTTTVFTNSMPNEASETQKPSKSSIVNDKATSETNNQHASTSTTAYPNAQLTTADPIIFEGLKKSEIDELTDKFQIVSNSSRISLESQAQGRLLSMANNNQNSGYAVNDIIISCSFNMISCDLEKDFAKVSDPWFGNCYTFNYDGKHSIVGSGNKFGLKIIAFSNVSEYLATTSQAGMKVVVHKQNFDPFPNNEGIYASVGSHVNVNVRYKSLEQLTAPYGVCRHENDTAGYIYDGRYRIEGCYRSCFQQRIIDACQCADPRFPKPRGLNISWCDVSNQAGFTCYVRYLSTKGDFMHVKNCICPHGCTEPDYTLDVWPSKWPIKKNNFTTPKCWGNYSGTKINCLKAYKDNAVAIDVTHNYMFYRRTYEQASFSVMDLILEIAGNLGLWTGFSMLVLGEIFNIFFFFLYRPNVDARIGDIEMSDMSNQSTSDIYDSANIFEEYGNDVPRPIIHASSAGGLIQDVSPPNDNVSSESEFEDEDFDLKEPDSYAAFLVKPELLYDISKEFGDATDDIATSEVKPRPLQGSKLVDRMYLELKKAGKIEPMCPVNFKKYHFAVPSYYNNETWNSGISQNVPSTDFAETEIKETEFKDADFYDGKLIKPVLGRDLGFIDEDYNETHGFPKSINPFPPIKGMVRTLADVPDDYKPYISNGRLCFLNSRKYYFPNEFQNDTSQSNSTKNADLSDNETQSSSSSTKNT